MDEKEELKDQLSFVKVLKNAIPKKEFTKSIGSVLNLTRSGVYKKISGQSNLTLKEVAKLCRAFGISFDHIIDDNADPHGPYHFESGALRFSPDSMHQYWTNILDHLERVKDLSGLNGIYLCNEIPYFYYLQFPNLLYFKMYVWNRTSWHLPLKNGFTYDKQDFRNEPGFKETTKEIVKFYNNYPSVEIWNPDMLNITKMQLSYYIESKVFSDVQDIRDILNDMEKMVIQMQDVANTGRKKTFGSLELGKHVSIYLNHLTINSEMILILSDQYKILYNKYDAPNYMRTDDSRVCAHLEQWLDDIINRSTLISVRNEKDRDKFFSRLWTSLDSFKDKVDGLIKSNYPKGVA